MLGFLIELSGDLPRRSLEQNPAPLEFHLKTCSSHPRSSPHYDRKARYDRSACNCALRGTTNLDDWRINMRGMTYYYCGDAYLDQLYGVKVIGLQPYRTSSEKQVVSLGELVLAELRTPQGLTRARLEELRLISGPPRGDVVAFMTNRLAKLRQCRGIVPLMERNYQRLLDE